MGDVKLLLIRVPPTLMRSRTLTNGMYHLTRLKCRLLQIIVLHPVQVIPRSRLMKEVWELDYNEAALALLTAVLQHPANMQHSLWAQEQLRDEAESVRAKLDDKLEPEAFATTWNKGIALELDAVVANMLEQTDTLTGGR